MITDQEVTRFIESYMLSNTPEFLLRRFLANPTLSIIVHRHSIDELLATVRHVNSESDGSVTELTRGYIALIALLVSADQKSMDILRLRDSRQLRWLAALVASWDRLRKPTSTESVSFASVLEADDSVRASASTSAVNIAFPE